ncbi:hypothetical protein SynMITS9220_02007 [Synechococcus sp. MIT S9220]|nr:hypothetical protein SynMITS9220_02007 [Synechococcus sp. MIT S9220]
MACEKTFDGASPFGPFSFRLHQLNPSPGRGDLALWSN